MANRVLQTPITVFSGAVSSVFLVTAAQAHRDGTISSITANTYKHLAHIALPPLLLFALIAPKLFATVFGAEWIGSGYIARGMIVWIYFSFVTSPLSILFSVLEKQHHELFYQGVMFATRLTMILWGTFSDSAAIAITFYAIGSALCQLGMIYWVSNQTKNSYLAFLRILLEALAWGIVTSLYQYWLQLLSIYHCQELFFV